MAMTSNERKARKKKALDNTPGIEVMEMRLFIEGGRLLWIEPIESEELKKSQATGEKNYEVDYLKEVSGDVLQHSSPVMIRQNSPACTYWLIYDTGHGIVKICLF